MSRFDTPQWDGSTGERVFYEMGVIYVHGADGEVWYLADPNIVNSSDITYMLENRPSKPPFRVTSSTIGSLKTNKNSIEALEQL